MQTVTVWLEDGVTSAWRGMLPVGLLKEAEVVLVPQRVGTYRLYARVQDASGCERDRTVTERLVVVVP